MNSVKSIVRRFLSLSLSLLLMLAMLPSLTFTAYAADVDGLTDSNIVLTSSGDASWTASGTSITGTATGTSGCSAASTTGSLTIKNNKSISATLSFDYSVTLNDGTVNIAGTSITQAGTFSREIAAGGTIVVNIASAKDAKTTEVKITNISLLADVTATVTYKAPVNGSYTVDGEAVTTEKTVTKNSSQATALAATAASGYRFYAWHDVTHDNYFAFTASYSANFDENITVEPYFVPASAPVFDVDGKTFIDLNDAITYATNNSKSTIVLVANGTLTAGTYTIPNGKTLLIPFDAAHTIYTTTPEVVYGSHTNPSMYRTLTMNNGAKIVVANGGKLCVPAKLSAYQTGANSWNGTPSGACGRITMKDGSNIEVQSGGGMYVYGYVSGSGTVNALSGATIYEAFQIRSWRGGTATTGMINKKVFPMNQYYVQNIEAPLTINAGAKEMVYTSVNMSSTAYPTSATFIGTNGLFNPTSGSVTKKYEGATDRLVFDINGNFTMSSMALSLAGQSVNTSSFVLPVTNNITININSGTSSINNDVCFVAGSKVTIADGATLNIGSNANIYVYDGDEWGPYAGPNLNLIPVGYSTVNGTAAKRTAANLTDVVFDVNGTINVSGKLYTTASGADITSSGKTGRINLNAAAPSATTTQQVTQSGTSITYVDINVTAAKLHNGDGSYTATAGSASGEFFTYSAKQNKWIKGEETSTTYTVTFKNAAGTVLKTVDIEEGGTVPASEVPALPATASNNNGTHTTYAWNASVTAPITADTTFTQVANTVNCSYGTPATIPASCTQAGSTTETCSVCGYQKVTTIPATGHTAGAATETITREATCTVAGEKTITVKCTVCGETISTTTQEIPAAGHQYATQTVAATPNERGYTLHTCSVCGDSYTSDETPYASDDSALISAKALVNKYVASDYTDASYAALTTAAATDVQSGLNPQTEIDAATANILSAISELAPYLSINVSARNASYTINLDGTNGAYATSFGSSVTVTATADENYVFYGWYDTVSHHYVSYDATYSFTAKTNLSLRADAVKAQSATLFFASDTGYVKRSVTKTTAQWAAMTSIDSLLPELPYSYTRTVIGWDYDNTAVLAQLSAGQDVTVTPSYENAAPEMPQTPTSTDVPAINMLYQYDADKNVGSYVIAPDVPATCTVEEIGIAYYYQKADTFVLGDFFLTNNNKLTTSKFTYDSNEAYYTVNVRFAKWKQNNWCARGYIVYRDANGTLKTAYSDQINVFNGVQQ